MTVMVSTDHKIESESTDEVATNKMPGWVDENSWTDRNGSDKCDKTSWKDLGCTVPGAKSMMLQCSPQGTSLYNNPGYP
jgi:hypothetical protein